MNYLAFQPAFDVFHTEFRLIRLRRLMSKDKPLHYDQLRIADFYLLFFFRLQDVRLTNTHRSIKKLARELSVYRYENQPDDQLVFSRMAPIQRAAMDTLIANKFFDAESFKRSFVVETDLREPAALLARIDEVNEREVNIMKSIRSLLNDYVLLGPNGLKDRTGLLEFRYDAV